MLGRERGVTRAAGLASVVLCLSFLACRVPTVGTKTGDTSAPAGPRVEIEDAWLDLHGHVVATFVATEDDLPLAEAEVNALAPRFTLATLTAHPVDLLRAWSSRVFTGSQVAARLPPGGPGTPDPEVLTSVRQPGAETPASFIDLGGGRYRYVFATELTAVDPDETIRVGMWLDAAASPSLATSSTFDFRPSGGLVEGRDTVLDENCGRCHGTLVMHGSRTRVRLCLTCHTWLNTDPDTVDPAAMNATAATDPNPLELGRLVHRIHRGKNLPTLYQSSSTEVTPDPLNTTTTLPAAFRPGGWTPVDKRRFLVIGDGSQRFVFGEVVQRTTLDGTARTVAGGVTFPRDLRDCDACHQSAAQAGQTVDAISRRTCSGCHPDIWFGATGPTDAAHLAHPGGPQTNDANCRGCHIDATGTSAPKVYAPIAGDSSAHVPIAKSKRQNMPRIEIVSVTGLVPGRAPVIRFKLWDRVGFIGPKPNAPTPATEPASETSSPVPRALSGLTIRMTGPGAIAGTATPDYTSLYGFPISSPASTSTDSALQLTATGGTDPEYIFTFASTIPATATGTWVVAMEAKRFATPSRYTKETQGYTFNWPYTGETVNETAENPIAYVDTATGSWPPDAPTRRRQVVAQEKCLRCHGRLELHGGNRHAVGLCLMCHAPDKTDYSSRLNKTTGFVNLGATFDGIEERSVHLKVLVHRIHTGGRKDAASLEGIEPHVVYGYGGTAYFFDEGIFPNDLRNCTICHDGKSYLVESVPADAAPTTANETSTIRHAASTATHSAGEPATPPIQAACLGCHASGATFAHVESKTVGGVETCANCHAKGPVSVEVAHGLAPPNSGPGSTFSSILQTVLVPRCATAACHSGNPPVAFPSLDADTAYKAIVDVGSQQSSLKLVATGAPEQSYLVYKLRGDAASVGGSGTVMPPSDALDPADIAAIEAWIANGAPND